MVSEYIDLREITDLKTKNRKTKVYKVIDLGLGCQIGVVKYVGSQRSYCLFPDKDIAFNGHNLYEIYRWCIQLTALYKTTQSHLQ